MVILIGGVGYAGKTFMAQQLLEKYQYPYLSIDHLKMGLYLADSKCGFTPTESVEVLGERLWPILKGIIVTNISNKQNIIIEGGYLFPEKIAELEDEYAKDIVSFYLGFSPCYLEKFFESKVLYHRNAIETRGYENDTTLEDCLTENKNLKELCQRYDAKYFEIDDDYQKATDAVYNWLDYVLSLQEKH